ncbi:MAG: ATP-dependent DNA helicase RecG [Anaerolineales bacterium]
MQSSISKLRKFFRLEAQRGYDNRAVLGGLETMLTSWEAEARADRLNDSLVKSIATGLRQYADLTREKRAETLKELWGKVQKETGVTLNGDVAQEKLTKSKPTRNLEPSPTPKHRRPRNSASPVGLGSPVTVLSSVGQKNAALLEALGIHTLNDMLYHFPRRYEDYSRLTPIRQLRYGEEVTVTGTIKSVNVRPARKGKAAFTELLVDDGTSALRATWFNQPWIARNFEKGEEVALSGKVDQFQGRFTLNNPEWEKLEGDALHTNRIIPIYPLTGKVRQRWLRQLMSRLVVAWAPQVPEILPESLVKSAGLISIDAAFHQVHFPDSMEQLRASQIRLAFNELFILQLAVLMQKRIWQGTEARRFAPHTEWLQHQISTLPYDLTNAQMNTLNDLTRDLASGRPMNRLLQGDVGSGKTVVAALGMAIIANQGAQAALMAPTSILAEQHYANLQDLLVGQGKLLGSGELRLMIGATPEVEKREIRDRLKSGEIKIVIGTHALIEDPVAFSELEMVVIDEQHRFGVGQRAALRSKGTNPHLLVMTATPIPRSLALTVYGDLDLSIINEMPPGRQPVETQILLPHERQRAYELVRTEVSAGHQAFIIYPLIEESEENEVKAAVAEHKRLQNDVFPDLKLALLHGRMSVEAKDESMARFRDGDAHILVSTTVIEVGVDVPNATMMLIEGANRFGLAQLHQLRGRVGRGAAKSMCILVPESNDAAENERLKAMSETNDGFILAEMDLKQRGPGQFLGTRQAGFADFRLASLADSRLIDKARRHAEELLAYDPELAQSEHKALADAVRQYFSDGKGDIS